MELISHNCKEEITLKSYKYLVMFVSMRIIIVSAVALVNLLILCSVLLKIYYMYCDKDLFCSKNKYLKEIVKNL